MSTASSRTPAPRPATLEDLLALPEESRRHEILDGELVEKEAAGFGHGLAQNRLGRWTGPFDRAPGGPQGPGGWWIVTDVTVQLSLHQIVRPDVAGWRRERLPHPPRTFPVPLRPDWVCEIMGDGDARRRDGLKKRRIYGEAGVPHYWLLDLDRERLTVLRLTHGGYIEVLDAGPQDRVVAEPFESLLLPLGMLFGEDVNPAGLPDPRT